MTLAGQMRGSQEEERDSRFYGVVVGVVTNIEDPENIGRIKVSFPWLSSEDESNWARIAHYLAGNDRGSWFIPEVGDEVLVAFEHGDIRNPYIIGCLYNGQDSPPSENDFSSDNNLRMFKSRSGHLFIFDDTSGSEQITIIASGGSSKVEIKADGNIEINCDNMKIKATDKLELEGMSVTIKASQKFSAEGTSGFEIKSTANGDVNASGVLNVKGSMVNIN